MLCLFEEKANLMIHRKIKHTRLVAQCKNYEEGKCSYTSESCYWMHGTKNKIGNDGTQEKVSCKCDKDVFKI